MKKPATQGKEMIQHDYPGLGKRLASLKPKGVTDAEWGDLLGIRRSTWASYVAEATYPPLDILIVLKSLTGASLDWLATGEQPTVGTIETNILVGVIQAIEEEVPGVDAISKAKLISRLYSDRIKEHSKGIEADSQPKGRTAS